MDFIEIKNVNPETGGWTSTEIIRTSDLLKIYKDCGDQGNGICFEFLDPAVGTRRQFTAYYPSPPLRDEAYEEYLDQLGAVRSRMRTGLSFEQKKWFEEDRYNEEENL